MARERGEGGGGEEWRDVRATRLSITFTSPQPTLPVIALLEGDDKMTLLRPRRGQAGREGVGRGGRR